MIKRLQHKRECLTLFYANHPRKVMDELAGKTALVTGATKRIGREISRLLAESGMHVVIHYRESAEAAEELCKELEACGGRAWCIRADLENAAECESLVSKAIAVAGPIEALVNNASLFLPDSLQDIDFGSLMKHMQVNAWAPFVLSREFARSGGAGKIVNILDSRAYDFSHLAYMLSKRMLSALTDMMAIKLAPQFTVNGVAPGPILPPADKDPAHLEKIAQSIPLRRHGHPRDVAEAVRYLLQSKFITGEVIYVDGGQHLGA